MRVLIVEDEALIAMSHEDAVAEAGHTVVGVAEDAASALELAEKARPELALVDLRLRDGPTGGAVAVKLRANYGIISILITGNIDQVPPEAKAACFALLPKPISHESLVTLLGATAKIIEGRARAR